METSSYIPTPPTVFGTGSRITVVCAECKRLKLRCDRRTPCASCVKRDTISRCFYFPGAAEKIDLQSVFNRILTLEGDFHAFAASGPRRGPFDEYDRVTLATGPSGSSLVVSMDDVASIWLEELGVLKDIDLRVMAPDYGEQSVKMAFPQIDLFMDPAHPENGPCVTRKLVDLMPDEATRDFLLRNLESTLLMHPCFNFPQFRNRVEALYNPDIWTATSPSSELDLAQPDATGESGDPQPSTTSPRRPSLSFFAAALAGLALGACTAIASPGPHSSNHSLRSPTGSDTGAAGLGSRSEELDSTSTLPPPTLPTQSSSDRPILNGFSPLPANVSADSFFTLSKQVLAVSEWNSNYDLDFIIAVILNGLYLLHDGKSSIAHTIFPSIGKLVNIAKMMGLHLDPDDFPGRYSLFDAEMRRRVWWDVYYYDLFMSDSMGQHPLIDDEMCTTRLPADVDEEKFHEGSQSLPAPRERSNFAYFIQKCRLARLIKTMRRRWVAEQPTMEMWLEAAQDFESEVVTWLAELPPQFRFSPVPQPPDEPENPFVVAQRCEIAAVAHSLVMKAYSPLLKRYPSRPYQPPSREAQLACVNAAHIIVQASQGIVKAFGGSRPASYVFYSFGRQIFAAAAVCANLVTHAPGAITAEPAMKDLATARELMRNPHVSDAKRHGLDSSALNPDKALRVVELLYAKAEEALRTGVPLLGGRGGHGGGDGEQPLPVGFTLPFMGGSLATGPGLPKVEPASTEHGDDVMQSTSPVRMSSGRGRLRSSATASRRGVEGAEERMLTRSSGRASTRAASVVDRTEVASIPLTVNGSKTPRARKPRKTSAYPSVGFRNRKNGPPTVKSLAIESMASGSTGSTHLSGPTVTGEIDAPGVPSGGPPLPPPQQTQLLPPPQPPHPGSFNMGLIAMPPTSSVGPETLVGVASPFRPPVHLPPVHHEQPRSHHGSPAPGPRSSMERRGSMSSSGFDSGAYAIPSDRQYHHYHDGAPRGTSYPTEYETPTTSSTSSGYYPSSYGAGAPTSSPYHHHPSSDPHHEALGTTIPGSGGRGTPVSRGGGANSPFTSMVPPPHAQPTVHHYHGPTFDAHSSGGRPSLRSPHDSFGYSSPGAVTAPAAEDHRLRYGDVDVKPSGVTSYGYEGGREGRTNINAVEGSRSHGGHHRSSASPPQGQQPHHHSQLQQPHPHLQTHHSHSQPYQPHQPHHQPRHVPSSPGPHTSLYGNGMQPAQSQGAATSPWSENPAYGTGGSWTDYGF